MSEKPRSSARMKTMFGLRTMAETVPLAVDSKATKARTARAGAGKARRMVTDLGSRPSSCVTARVGINHLARRGATGVLGSGRVGRLPWRRGGRDRHPTLQASITHLDSHS